MEEIIGSEPEKEIGTDVTTENRSEATNERTGKLEETEAFTEEKPETANDTQETQMKRDQDPNSTIAPVSHSEMKTQRQEAKIDITKVKAVMKIRV